MTVIVFDFVSAPNLKDPDLVRRAFELRQQEFNSVLEYAMPSWQGMEFDVYDNLASTYLVRVGDHGTVQGFTRINPTMFENYDHSLNKDIWSDLVDATVPAGRQILEGSRFVISPKLSSDHNLRTRVIDELVLGIMEYSLKANARYVMGAMYPKVWDSVFGKRGWGYRALGAAEDVGGGHGKHVIVAGIKEVSLEIYREIQNKTGIHESVLDITLGKIIGNQQRRGPYGRSWNIEVRE